MRPLLVLALLASLLAAALAAWALLAPETGVTGTLGAGLALGGAAAVALGALLLLAPGLGTGLRRLLLALALPGAALTAVAGWFLMQWGVAGAMLVAFLALLAAPLLPARGAAA